MEPNRTRQLADRFIERLLRFEEQGAEALEDLVALFADDADIVNPALYHAGRSRVGPDELRRFWLTYRDTLGEAHSEFERVTTSEDAAGLFWTTRASGHEGVSSNAIAYDGATALVFDEEGRIRHFRAYFNFDDLAHPAAHRGGTRAGEERGDIVSDSRQPVGYG